MLDLRLPVPGVGESVQIKPFAGSSVWKCEQSSGNLKLFLEKSPGVPGVVDTLHLPPESQGLTRGLSCSPGHCGLSCHCGSSEL